MESNHEPGANDPDLSTQDIAPTENLFLNSPEMQGAHTAPKTGNGGIWLFALVWGIFCALLGGILTLVLIRFLPSQANQGKIFSPISPIEEANNLPPTPYSLPTVYPTPTASLPSPLPTATLIPTPTPTGTPTSSPSASPSQVTGDLDEAKAVGLVNEWLQAKPKIFSDPFDRELADQIATGKLHDDITKQGGAIDWLKSKNARYEYDDPKIESTESFSTSGNTATIVVKVAEDVKFYVDNQIEPSETGTQASKISYTLQQENGSWKISDSEIIEQATPPGN